MTKISIILCTYNGKAHLTKCLDSILSQSYKDFEVICMDGMSKDNTIEIIKRYMKKDKRVKLMINKKRLPEGKGKGKWLGFKNAKGEIVGVIDQDNILQSKDFFEKVVQTFDKNKDITGVLGGLKHDKKDEPVVRYISLFGTDPFFAYRSLDFLQRAKYPASQTIFNLKSDNMTITGGNVFFYLKKSVEQAGGYDQDVLMVSKLLKQNKKQVHVIKNSTKHYSEKNLLKLIKKFTFGRKSYYQRGTEKFNYLPNSKLERKEFLKDILIIPSIIQSLKICAKEKDAIALLHPLMLLIGTISYSINYFR